MHEYQRRIMKAHALGRIPDNKLTVIEVRHDDCCGFNRGKFCDCDPDITFTDENFLYHIDEYGAYKREKLH